MRTRSRWPDAFDSWPTKTRFCRSRFSQGLVLPWVQSSAEQGAERGCPSMNHPRRKLSKRQAKARKPAQWVLPSRLLPQGEGSPKPGKNAHSENSHSLAVSEFPHGKHIHFALRPAVCLLSDCHAELQEKVLLSVEENRKTWSGEKAHSGLSQRDQWLQTRQCACSRIRISST